MHERPLRPEAAPDVSDPHQQRVSRLLHQLNAGDRRRDLADALEDSR
jgi:hypothetical protein